MMAPSRGVCFEGRLFFVYDREAVKKENDPPENAILYFCPPGAKIEQQITICGQLVGMTNFLSGFTGMKSPCLVKLETEKVAMIHVGKYSLALGGDLVEPDTLLCRQLETLYHVFAFYHSSIDHVRRLHEERSIFLTKMRTIWDCYLPFVRHYGDNLPGVFDPVPFLDLPKKAATGFMKASHFLQACQRRRHILVGCLLYNNSVVCSQLDPDIMSRLLLLKPNQSHHPAQPVETDFSLPYGLRILDCFVTLSEYVTLYNAVAQSPYRQLNAANPLGTFPDMYNTPANYERKPSTTDVASPQSNSAHLDLQDSKNQTTALKEGGNACDSRKLSEFQETPEGSKTRQLFTEECRKTSGSRKFGESKESCENLEEVEFSQSNVTQSDLDSKKRVAVVEVGDKADEFKKTCEFTEKRDSPTDVIPKTGDNKKFCESEETCESSQSQGREKVSSNSSKRGEVDGRITGEHIDLDGETGNIGKEGNTRVPDDEARALGTSATQEVLDHDDEMQTDLSPKRPKSRTANDEFYSDAGVSATPDDNLCEQELVMEAIDVEELRIIECCPDELRYENSTAGDDTSALPQEALRAPEATEEPSQASSEQVACTGCACAADGGETGLISTDVSPDSRTVRDVACDVSERAELESVCRDFLNDIVESVATQLEGAHEFENATAPGDAVGVESGPGTSARSAHGDCSVCNYRSVADLSLSGGNGRSAGVHVSRDTRSAFCRSSSACGGCSKPAITTPPTTSKSPGTIPAGQAENVASESLVRLDDQHLPNRNVTFEDSIVVLGCATGTHESDQVHEEKSTEENGSKQEEGDNLGPRAISALVVGRENGEGGDHHKSQCLGADSEETLGTSTAIEDSVQDTPCVQSRGPGESSDSGAVAASDSGCASRPSVSRDEEPSGGATGPDVDQIEGMAHVSLYVQAHSEIVLILLADPDLKSDQETIRALWETSLNQLGDLEARIKQAVGSVTQSNAKEEYSYLVYDRFEKAMKGNLREPITQVDHVFCETAKCVHEQFNSSPSLHDVTLRSRSSGVYCKRNLGREMYFQRKGSFRTFPGVPYPRDPTFTLEKRSAKVLLKEHGINVF